MKPDDSPPILTSARSAILLVFVPLERADRQQRASLTALTNLLQEHLGGLLRIIRIDETTNPDVVQSFSVTHVLTFVLVRQGIELWRQEGLSDETPFVRLIQRLLLPDPATNQPMN